MSVGLLALETVISISPSTCTFAVPVIINKLCINVTFFPSSVPITILPAVVPVATSDALDPIEKPSGSNTSIVALYLCHSTYILKQQLYIHQTLNLYYL